jgi:hypothetical protein
MELTCPECTNEISDGDTECPRCGTLIKEAAPARAADDTPAPPQALPLMSIVNEPQPPAKPSLVLATRVVAIVFAGWLAALAAFAWSAYSDGYTELLLPGWNTLFFVGTLPLVAGLFARRMWAQRWVIGIAVFTGLGHVMQAAKSGSTILWIGVLLLAVVAVVLGAARPIFRHDNAHRGTLPQLIATAVTIGSILVYFAVENTTGSERGRTQFAAEIQENYSKQGSPAVRVFVEKTTLVIEGLTDTDEQIDQAANMMTTQLRTHGANAKAWVLGFSSIKLTNGTHSRWLRRAEFAK